MNWIEHGDVSGFGAIGKSSRMRCLFLLTALFPESKFCGEIPSPHSLPDGLDASFLAARGLLNQTGLDLADAARIQAAAASRRPRDGSRMGCHQGGAVRIQTAAVSRWPRDNSIMVLSLNLPRFGCLSGMRTDAPHIEKVSRIRSSSIP